MSVDKTIEEQQAKTDTVINKVVQAASEEQGDKHPAPKTPKVPSSPDHTPTSAALDALSVELVTGLTARVKQEVLDELLPLLEAMRKDTAPTGAGSQQGAAPTKATATSPAQPSPSQPSPGAPLDGLSEELITGLTERVKKEVLKELQPLLEAMKKAATPQTASEHNQASQPVGTIPDQVGTAATMLEIQEMMSKTIEKRRQRLLGRIASIQQRG